jgi:hypothetical protein
MVLPPVDSPPASVTFNVSVRTEVGVPDVS